MKKSVILAGAVICLAAGVLAIVTAASLVRRAGSATMRTVDVQVTETEEVSDANSDASSSEATASQSTWMTEYELTERSGKTFHSNQLSGKVHVVNFFFSSCPSVCRMQSGKVQELATEFGPQGVKFLSITCDPENDSPATLQNYASIFNADPEDWLFLTGDDLTYLRRVGAEVYQVPVDKQIHSERLVLVNTEGQIHGAYHWNQPKEMAELRKSLKTLLNAASSAPVATDS